MLKKIALFSDIHGNYEALKTLIKKLKEEAYDEIICLGDTLSYGPQPKECLYLIMNNDIKLVLGEDEIYITKNVFKNKSNEYIENMEWVKSELDAIQIDYLKTCPLYYECKIDYDKMSQTKLLFAHFLLKDNEAIYPFEEVNIKNNIDLWFDYNDEYENIYIGHEHDSCLEDDIIYKNKNNEDYIGMCSNLWLVGSSGCTSSDILEYTSLEIGRSRVTSRKYLQYNKEKYLKKQSTKLYPYEKDINLNYVKVIKS